jgi:hypothetical protein
MDPISPNTCSTCKHFGHFYTADKNGVTACDRANWYEEDNPTTDGDGSKYFGILATASDDSGLYAKLMVGPEFGCIHHEK